MTLAELVLIFLLAAPPLALWGVWWVAHWILRYWGVLDADGNYYKSPEYKGKW
jgi:hypothetical protein